MDNSIEALAQGLSPRVRGKRPGRCWQSRQIRSIPACAGEADVSSGYIAEQEVYPRVCGGSGYRGADGDARRGLSPRVRGKLAPAAA